MECEVYLCCEMCDVGRCCWRCCLMCTSWWTIRAETRRGRGNWREDLLKNDDVC